MPLPLATFFQFFSTVEEAGKGHNYLPTKTVPFQGAGREAGLPVPHAWT